jgi:hypothetical protein
MIRKIAWIGIAVIVFLGVVLLVLRCQHVDSPSQESSSVEKHQHESCSTVVAGQRESQRDHSDIIGSSQNKARNLPISNQSSAAEDARSNARQSVVVEVKAPTERVANVLQSRGGSLRDEYRRRTAAVWLLGNELTAQELDAIFNFLLVSRPNESADSLSLNSIKNDLLDMLVRQSVLPSQLGRFMMNIISDENQDEVFRDYCLQHLAPYYDRKWPATRKTTNDFERQEMFSTYHVVLSNTTSSMAGTALIGLFSLSEQHPEFDQVSIGCEAQRIAANAKYGIITRVTAMQVCGRARNGNILPIARIEAQSSASVQLRMASIATLGDVGDQSDIELLSSLSSDEEERVRLSALSAKKRLLAQVATRNSN